MARQVSATQKGNHMNSTKRSRAAFTLVEIMIVVAIIGLLAVIAVPGFIRSRQLSQGRALINDARQIDAAIDQWALENGITDGTAMSTTSMSAVAAYLKPGPLQSKLAASQSSGQLATVLATNSVSIGNIGSQQVRIATAAKSALSAVTDWGNY
jgi:prepilin-type N-terminal cleavage/methylation domain-containing protein